MNICDRLQSSYDRAMSGGVCNDHDYIARMRPVDVIAAKREIELGLEVASDRTKQLREARRLKEFTVSVLGSSSIAAARRFVVVATTEEDALMLALALDGGWSASEEDARGMLELAKSYCKIEDVK